MATLTNKKIKDTYKSLLKVSDNGNLEAALKEISDGEGNASGVQLNTAGDLTASGTVAFGSLKDSGENITISKFVDEADGIASNDNDTTIPTSAAVKNYVDTKVTAEDLDFGGDSGTGSVDLDSQTFTIAGTANEVVTSASGQTLTVGLPSTINVDVQGDLTGNVTGNVSGNVTGNVTGNVSGDLTGNVTATSVLANGVTATTQASSDNSTKVATTAFVKSVVTAEDLDFAGDSGTGAVDLDSQTLSIVGTANEIVTSASGQTLTVGLPSSITVNVTGNLTGNVSGNVTGDVTGNADTATALETSRTIALSGDVVGSGSFDGSANLTLSTTIQPNSVALGTDTTGDYVSNLGAGTGVTIANNTGEGSNPTIAVNYGSTANTSVEGDTLVTIQGTTNEIEVSGGAVTLGAGGTVTVGLPDNVIIAGDLTVNGTTTTINTQTLSVEDPLIELANQNASNSVDTGFFANYSLDAGVTTKYAGLFKDSSDSDKFKLFKGLEVEPATTVDVAGTGYTKGDLVVGSLEADTVSGVLANGVTATTQSAGDNSTKVATTAYVDSIVTAQDLDFAGGTGTGSVDLDSQTFTIAGTANEIETSASGQTITIGLPSSVTVGTLNATTLGGTLSTAAQPNITSVGTLSSLAVSGDVTIDSTTLYVDSSNNRIGIGTTLPAAGHILDINTASGSYPRISGTDQANVRLRLNNGGAGGRAYEIVGGLNGANNSSFSIYDATAAATRLAIDSSGNLTVDTNTFVVDAANNRVGVGTSTPKNTAHINGSLQIGYVDALNDAMVLSWGGSGTAGTIQTFSSSALALNPAGNNVGIGTSSPASLLHIQSNSSPTLTLDHTEKATWGVGDVIGKIDYYTSDASGNAPYSTAFIQSENETGAGTLPSGALVFGTATYNAVGGAVERLRIDSAGNVGIGESSARNARLLLNNAGSQGAPQLMLIDSDSSSQQGEIRFDSGNLIYDHWNGSSRSERMRINSSGQILIGGNVTPTLTSAKLFISRGDQYGLGMWADGATAASYVMSSEDNLILGTAATEKMRINSSGNVGIGTSSPTLFSGYTTLSVNNSSQGGIVELQSNGTSGLRLACSSTDSALWEPRNVPVLFATNNTERMRILSSGGITFNGDTAAANALDDYEEGTWTMGVSFGGASAGVTYTLNTGSYTKIGNQVTVTGLLGLSSKGSSTGAVTITGLPFTINNSISNYSAASLAEMSNISFADMMYGYGGVNTTTIVLKEITNAGATSSLTDANFSNNSEIMISFTYFV